jgi:transcriptional regulator with XRE-family HTH domain
MTDRRTLSSSLSADVIAFLRKRGHSQARISRMLGVSESYVSLVKSRERALTLDHMELLAEKLGLPLGALLLAVVPRPRNPSPDVKSFFKLAARLIEKADVAEQAILNSFSSRAI